MGNTERIHTCVVKVLETIANMQPDTAPVTLQIGDITTNGQVRSGVLIIRSAPQVMLELILLYANRYSLGVTVVPDGLLVDFARCKAIESSEEVLSNAEK